MATPTKSAEKIRKPRVPKTDSQKVADFRTKAPVKVDRLLKGIAGLKALARPTAYTWTPAQREAIFSALAAAVEAAEKAFRNPTTKPPKEGFRLPT